MRKAKISNVKKIKRAIHQYKQPTIMPSYTIYKLLLSKSNPSTKCANLQSSNSYK